MKKRVGDTSNCPGDKCNGRKHRCKATTSCDLPFRISQCRTAHQNMIAQNLSLLYSLVVVHCSISLSSKNARHDSRKQITTHVLMSKTGGSANNEHKEQSHTHCTGARPHAEQCDWNTSRLNVTNRKTSADQNVTFAEMARSQKSAATASIVVHVNNGSNIATKLTPHNLSLSATTSIPPLRHIC